MKRTFVMLANHFSMEKARQFYLPSDYYVSEKLDGMRAFWDGGLTRGMPLSLFPWLGDMGKRVTATGLWSRYMQPIMAPAGFVASLPKGVALDGELWLGRGRFQELVSITKRHDPEEWRWADVSYKAFDAPVNSQIWGPGTINDTVNDNVSLDGFYDSVLSIADRSCAYYGDFTSALERIPDAFALRQELFPSWEAVTDYAASAISAGGEGVMLRCKWSKYELRRSNVILKLKPHDDCVAEVIGFEDGEGKYVGMIGSLTMRGCESPFEGVVFNLSGMNDALRVHGSFSLGQRIKFRYTSLTKDGKPREARYLGVV